MPRTRRPPRLVKYLLNNRQHATYWNSTRDTAICIEAMADYLKASGEDRPDMTVEVWLDGKKHKEVQIDDKNLFTFDNKLRAAGDAVETGKHTLEIKRKGTGPVYFNAYLTNFTLEDFITKAGLEVKVNRKYYKLTRVDEKIKVPGSRGQAARSEGREVRADRAGQPGRAQERRPGRGGAGDRQQERLRVPAVRGPEGGRASSRCSVRSGYIPNDMGAYMELRDEQGRASSSATLPRGKHSVSYRLRAEIPGQFSALPTRGVGDVRTGAEGQFRRDQVAHSGLTEAQ